MSFGQGNLQERMIELEAENAKLMERLKLRPHDLMRKLDELEKERDEYYEGYMKLMERTAELIRENKKLLDEIEVYQYAHMVMDNNDELRSLVRDLFADLMEYGCMPNAHRADYAPRFCELGIGVSK